MYFGSLILYLLVLSHPLLPALIDRAHERPSGSVPEMDLNNESQWSGPCVTATGFLYHRFEENEYPSTSISADLFEEQLKYLADHNLPVITLGEYFRLPDTLEQDSRFVIITIDDAFSSFFKTGFPLLRKYGMKATLFVNTETVGAGDYADWEELKEMHRYGIEIGNHTHTHAYFLDMPEDTRLESFRKEVLLSREIFRKQLNVDCSVFAYPFGEYDEGMKRIIMEAGFSGAAAQHSGVISCFADRFALPRFPMTDRYGKMSSFIEKVNMNALPVIATDPPGTVAVNNPPSLQVYFRDLGFDMDRLQGFVQGGECILTLEKGDTVHLGMLADAKLNQRRHLYTLTVPHKQTGEWYWFSRQWIFPEIR